MVQKQNTFSRNPTSDFEFWSFPRIVICNFLCEAWQQQLLVSHTVNGCTTDTQSPLTTLLFSTLPFVYSPLWSKDIKGELSEINSSWVSNREPFWVASCNLMRPAPSCPRHESFLCAAYPCCLRSPPSSRLVASCVIRSTVVVLQCFCLSNPHFTC